MAIPPLQPSGPNRRKIVAIALILGLAIGVGGVVLVEATARSVRAGAELTESFGLPVLAILPRQGRQPVPRLLRRLASHRPGGPAEAAAELATTTLLSGGASSPRVVAVMGSVAGEEAPVAALMLAQAAAMGGTRTLLVDTNLRRPWLSVLLARGNPGLSGLLDQDLEPADVIVADPDSGLWLLPAVRNPGSRITHRQIADLVGRLRADYDLIVLNSPPVLATADAAAIGRAADAVIYAVRWRRTPRSAVRQGLDRLAALGVHPTGFVLTATDRRREARHAFARYGTGYGQLVAGHA